MEVYNFKVVCGIFFLIHNFILLGKYGKTKWYLCLRVFTISGEKDIQLHRVKTCCNPQLQSWLVETAAVVIECHFIWKFRCLVDLFLSYFRWISVVASTTRKRCNRCSCWVRYKATLRIYSHSRRAAGSRCIPFDNMDARRAHEQQKLDWFGCKI